MEALHGARALVLATTTSYPAPILWGNCLWATVYFRLHCRSTSSLQAILWSYIFLAYPGNFCANALALGRVPGAISSATIFPTHVAVWMLVNLCPGDLVFTALKTAPCLVLLDFIGGVDNMTTAFQFVWAGHTHYVGSEPAFVAILAGVLQNCGGALLRHFDKYGWEEGKRQIQALWPNLRASILVIGVFYTFAVRGAPRQGDVAPSLWFEVLSYAWGIRAAFGGVGQIQDWLLEQVAQLLCVVGSAIGFQFHQKQRQGSNKAQ